MSNALAGLGVDLKVGSSGSSSFSTIAEVLDITGPGETLNVTEATNHDSTYVPRVPTTLDGGELTFDVNWIPGDATQGSTGANALKKLMRAKEGREYRVFYSSTSSRYEKIDNAFVTSFEGNFPVEDVQTGSVTLSVDGAVSTSTST